MEKEKQPKRNPALRAARLRRVDWRFLLPSPDGVFQHMVLLGGPDSLSKQILKTGIARKVSDCLPSQDLADAIAVLSPARVDFEQACACLAPGGSLYFEIDRRRPGYHAFTPELARRRLQKAGLRPTGVYWAAPDFESCKRYIPLDAPEPFQWYLSTLYVAGTPVTRLVELAVQFLNRSHLQFQHLAPCFAVTAAPLSQAFVSPSVFAGGQLPARLQKKGTQMVLLTSGQDDGSRAVLLPFAPGSKQPEAVIKISTLPDFNANIEREQAALSETRALLGPSMAHSIPEPLGQFRYGGLAVGIEQYAPGQPLFVSSGRWPASLPQQIEDMELAARWLCQFHTKSQVDRLVWSEAAAQQWIEPLFSHYEQIFKLTADEEKLFSAVRSRSKELTGANFPIIRMHYDFIPWNIYRDRQHLTVIDWEFGGNWLRERTGPALYDLLFLITYWAHLVFHVRDEQGELMVLSQLFLQPNPIHHPNPYIQAAHHALDGYIHSVGVDRRFLPVILVYLWAEQACHRFLRREILAPSQSEARDNNTCVRHVGFLAKHTDRLFAYH